MLSAYLVLAAAAVASPHLATSVLSAVGDAQPARAFGMGSAALVLVTVFAAVFALMVFVGGVREGRRRRRDL